jgi:hypothetical protein
MNAVAVFAAISVLFVSTVAYAAERELTND